MFDSPMFLHQSNKAELAEEMWVMTEKQMPDVLESDSPASSTVTKRSDICHHSENQCFVCFESTVLKPIAHRCVTPCVPEYINVSKII